MGKGAVRYIVIVDAELSGAVPITTGAVSPLSSRWARRSEFCHEYRISLVAALPILRNYAGLGKIAHVEVIAVGGSIRDIIRLQKQYGSGRWKKLKGIATVRLENGHIRTAEVHWYEAHGIGKKKNEGQETIGLKR